MHDEGQAIWSGEHEVCAAEVDRLFRTFATYVNPGKSFCSLCYTPEEVERITQKPLADLDEESGRQLLWETADHWESADVYRHYLPRVLQLMGPPWFLDDLYPTHLFATLLALDFRRWPSDEQSAVVEFLECVAPLLKHSEVERRHWAVALAGLRDPQRLLPPASIPDSGDA